jgi:hypothetical protein
MLNVAKYLTEKTESGSDNFKALEELKTDYGIKANINLGKEPLVVLNYCQIESPKTHPITTECRSLVLEMGTWNVVSRSFDRFFNLGEVGEVKEEWVQCPANGVNRFRTMTFHEKMDGSLIGLFSYKGKNLYRTRSVIMPTGEINGMKLTWKDAIEQALPDWWFDTGKHKVCIGGHTYICELTCRENRVVVNYDEAPRLTLLAARDNLTGTYSEQTYLEGDASWLEVSQPKTYRFTTTDECLQAVKSLPNLEEGYVGYNPAGEPCVKVKNPAYVAAHHLKGEGLNEKRILDLVIMEEVPEYLAVFPEDEERFKPYTDAYFIFSLSVHRLVGLINTEVVKAKSQKDFALFFKDFPEAAIIFQVRRGQDWKVVFNKLSADKKRSLILGYVGGV